MAVPTLVASTIVASTDKNDATTSAINTTGATALFVWLACSKSTTSTVTDSKGNTWTALTKNSASILVGLQLWYCTTTPTVGTGHTFTSSTVTNSYPALAVQAFSGVANGATPDINAFVTNTFTFSNSTPASNNEVVLAAIAFDASGTIRRTSRWTDRPTSSPASTTGSRQAM
jgi:hypothetical protein